MTTVKRKIGLRAGNPKKQKFDQKKQKSDKIQKDTKVNNLAQVVEIRRFARFGTIFKI